MVKTLPEFRDDLRALREEMFSNAENADLKLVASWVDRLAMALEDLSVTLELMDQSVDTASGLEPELDSEAVSAKVARPAKKAPAKPKKKAKAAKKKRR